MKARHKVYWKILYPLVKLFCFVWFGYTCRKPKNLPESYIVLANHNTDFDPLFVGCAFKRQMYFVASEHISRWGFVYKLIDHLLAPILRYKGTIAVTTAVEVLKKIKKGGNVCLFAEGMRSWDGVTGPILPSTAKLVKSAGCGLVTYKLVGGYFVSPNWSEKSLRRGKVYGEPVGVYSKEEIAAMSAEELDAIICRDLYEDAYERQLAEPARYRGKRLAEKLENLLYLCPNCQAQDALVSKGDTVTCGHCGASFSYDALGMLQGLEQKTVKELSDIQRQAAEADVRADRAYTAPHGTLCSVAKRRETFLTAGPVSMSAQALSCGDFTVPMTQISDLAIHGRHELVFSVGKEYYELRPDRPASAYKFFLYYGICKKLRKEAQPAE